MNRNPIVVLVWTDNPEAHTFLTRDYPQLKVRIVTERKDFSESVSAAEVIYLGRRHDRSFITGASRLRWLHIAATGVDQLGDIGSLPGVRVTNMPGLNSAMMADYCMCTLMMLTWNMPSLLEQQREKTWQGHKSERLEGKTLLILGLGNVGRALVPRARAAGLRTIGLRRTGADTSGVEKVYLLKDLPNALASADYVVCTLPATSTTQGLLNREAFRAMKSSAYLVNVGRGAVVNEKALLEALDEGQIAGAALDVCSEEPLPGDHPLWNADRLIITPHVSGFSADYRTRAARVFADNLERYIKDLPLKNVVDGSRGY